MQINMVTLIFTAILTIIMLYLYFHSKKETLSETLADTGKTSLAVVDDNAFTGLTCLNDTIFRYKNVDTDMETLRCLVNPKTGECYQKDHFFDAGKAPSCEKFNETLVKQVRDVSSTPRKIFNASNPYSVNECTVHGLNNKDHWCNKVIQVILNTDCSDPFKNRIICEHQPKLAKFLNKESTETRDTLPLRYSLSGASCITKCRRSSGAIPPNPATYDCKIKSKGKVIGPDTNCDATKAKMQVPFNAYNVKYGECLSKCIS